MNENKPLGGGRILLSIVVPCYNEEESIESFYDKTSEILASIKYPDFSYEIIFVDDGSKDRTIEKIQSLHNKDKRIKFIKFSRNFGKESAILAGFKASGGKCVVLMDADLQHPPELIAQMFDIWSKNKAKIIYARRRQRTGENKVKSMLSELFYIISRKLSQVKMESGVSDFRLMDICVVKELLKMGEYHRFSKAMFEWVGFKRVCLEYEYAPRVAGDTSWSFWKLFNYAIEGFVSFSTAPLRVAFVLGFLVSLFAFVFGSFIILKTIIYGVSVSGYASLMVSMLFLGGVILIVLGIIGEYIARIYEQVKNRPHYIIENFQL